MPRYTRLRGSDFEESDFLFVKASEAGAHYMHEKLDADQDGAAALDHGVFRANYERTLSTEILSSSKSQYMKGFSYNNRSLSVAPLQNIENGNPNVTLDPTAIQAIAAACAQSANGVSFSDQKVGVNIDGASSSGRWVAKTAAEERKPAGGVVSFRRDDGSKPSQAADAEDTNAPPPSGGGVPWAASVHRVASYREVMQQQIQHPVAVVVPSVAKAQTPAPAQVLSQVPMPDDKPCTLHSSCNDVRLSQRFTDKNPPSFIEKEKETSTPATGMKPERPLAMLIAARSRNSTSDSENGIHHERSVSAVQRSLSMRDMVGHRTDMHAEDWSQESRTATTRRAHSGAGSRHRVSFSVVENHHGLDDGNLEQNQHEKWREPPINHRILTGKNPEPMRYNYQQPGFVEREKDVSGRAYTVYSVNSIKKDSSKNGRQPPLSRAFSLREKGSNYTRIARTFTGGTGKHSVHECVSCGRGLGIVVHGFSGNESSFCPFCRPSAAVGQGSWNFPDKPCKKKKSMLDYCRKFLGLSKKGR